MNDVEVGGGLGLGGFGDSKLDMDFWGSSRVWM
jgi:hypothetical protein